MPTLPNPGMSFTPFDPLPAADLNDMVENIEAIADLSIFANGDIPRNLIANQREGEYDFVASGLVLTADAAGSTLLASLSSGVVYIGGIRVPVSAVNNRAYTASRDTYVDVGVDGVVDFNVVTNNNASPALAANHIRLGIVVTGASSIAAAASINQGQQDRLLPIASSTPYAVTDSLGNLICPRDPSRRILGYREINANVNGVTSTTPLAVTGLSCPVIVPTGRKVRVTVHFERTSNSSSGSATALGVYDTTVSAANTLAENVQQIVTGGQASACGPAIALTTPSTNSKTYAAGIFVTTGTGSFVATALGGGGKAPAFIMVELV